MYPYEMLRAMLALSSPPSLPLVGISRVFSIDAHSRLYLAWMLNLRGRDIPFNPVFQSYLYVGTEKTILFIDQNKINDEVGQYLSSISVETRSYDDVWNFLGSDDMGSGKVLITGQTSYAIANKLHGRFTDTASYVDEMKAVKNDVELEGFRKAYTRDSAAYVSVASLTLHAVF
jgi:Xaa-Pro aminopeptidase